ncbi:hypothetical protein C2845_PM13G20600 [Panicum miliaceum]|uniref:Wall-associated receptor kinase 2-like n=1 Tax=Panicum miliaceum TaxID=4540 RepID=A0A3L6RNC2_PANMI|nr:hypothetical protein C2845_PM13G20600 [Panicum miliaceum]
MSMDKNIIWWNDFTDSQFRLSDEDNRFTVIGCNSLAYVGSANTGSKYMTGCMATCPAAGRLENGSCSGMGCCQAAIPRGINTYQVQFDGRFTTSRTRGFSRCSYAALVEAAAAAFDFRTTYVTADDFMESTGGKAPLVLDWVVGKETCREAARNTTAYMCVSSNSECVDSRNGPGYLCNCSRGYDGNPYVHDGCQDVNECTSSPALFLEPVSTLLEDSSDPALTRQQATLTMAHARPRNLNLECTWQLMQLRQHCSSSGMAERQVATAAAWRGGGGGVVTVDLGARIFFVF